MEKNVIMEFDYMHYDNVCATVKVYQGGRVCVDTFTTQVIWLPFGTWCDKATIKDVYDLLEFRCFPRTRFNCRQLLDAMGCKEYSPRDIIKVTHGLLADDKHWIRFSDERSLNWETVSEFLPFESLRTQSDLAKQAWKRFEKPAADG